MKILFLTADLGGNVPPTLAVANALEGRGASIIVAGLHDGATSLPQVPFPAATDIAPVDRAQGPREALAAAKLLAGRSTSRRTAELIEEQRVDLVVVDCMLPAVIRGALASSLPVVVLFHTFGGFWIRSFDRGFAGRALGILGLRPRTLWGHAASRVILADAELDPGRDDPALADSTWAGTTELGSAPSRDGDPSSLPRVLVSLSSAQYPGMLRVYRRIIAGLTGLPIAAVITTGGVELGGELNGSANAEVRGWADHHDLLRETRLVIGHGGHSTTMRALAHGVPLLVLPVNPISDQPLIARIVEHAGLGRRLPKSASSGRIREAVRAMLDDPTLRESTARIGQRLRSQPSGAEVAAERILDVLNGRG